MRIIAGNDTEHQRADEEALNLNPTTAKDLNEEDCEEVTRHVTGRSNDEIAVSILDEGIVLGLAF